MENNYLRVEDNYLSDSSLFKIKKLNFDCNFPLFKNYVKPNFYLGEYKFHLEHTLYYNNNITSDYIYLLDEILKKINPKEIHYAAIIQIFKNSKKINTPTITVDSHNTYNFVLFIDWSNLELNLLGGSTIDSKQNRAVFYKNSLKSNFCPQTNIPISSFLKINYSV